MAIENLPGINFGGLMTYPPIGKWEDVNKALLEIKRLLEDKKIDVPVISVGGSPDMWNSDKILVATEYRIGTYIYNETITGESSGVTAKIRDFRTITSTTPGVLPVTNIRVSLNTGKFSPGETVVGTISSARYTVLNYDTESYDNPYDTNEEIELEADDILDFSESNPFGNY